VSIGQANAVFIRLFFQVPSRRVALESCLNADSGSFFFFSAFNQPTITFDVRLKESCLRFIRCACDI